MTATLDSFRALASADVALQAELASAGDEDAFVATAIAIARRHNIALAPDDLAPLVAPDPIGMVQRTPPPIRIERWPPAGWLPYGIAPDGGNSLAIDWADFTGIALDGCFQAEAVRTALARPFNRLLRCRTGLADFLQGAPVPPPVPDAFIFHMSRCGSTLVARMLAALPGAYAINEADPIDTMIRAANGAPEETQVAVLRAIVGALGRRPARHWFVKLSAWPALALPLFRRAFPDVPWIFLYRDPAEVLASQMITRAPELAPGFTPSSLFGIKDGERFSDETYIAMALARVCEAALAADGGLFVDHADLPEAFFSAILPHFGIDAAAARRTLPAGIAQAHAKHPDLPWRPAPATIDPAVRAAADAHLAPLYGRLKTVRGGKSLL